MEFECTRRDTIKGIAGFGLTCSISNSATAATPNQTPATQKTNTDNAAAWQTYEISGHPFTIRYRDGYKADAQTVADWAVTAQNKHSDVYTYQVESPFTFDLYPKEEHSRPAFNASYSENERSIRMMAPSDYTGNLPESKKERQFLHLVSHELAHVYQTEALKFHSHLRWPVEGFAEALAVYYTDDGIKQQYLNRFDAVTVRRRINHGHGFFMGVNADQYRGSMQVFRFMIENYGGQNVFDIYDQTATSFVEAIDKQLGLSPHDLELEWLQYARRTFGGNYIDPILRLGGDIDASVALDKSAPAKGNSVTVEDAIAQESFIIGVYNGGGELIGESPVFESGQVRDVEIDLNTAPDSLEELTAQLHSTMNGGEMGEPITVNNGEVTSQILYTPESFSIAFAEQPVAGDTSVKINAYLDPTDQHYQDIPDKMPYSKYSNSLRIKVSEQSKAGIQYRERVGVKAGNQVIRHKKALNSGNSAIPLNEGDTITLKIRSGQGANQESLASTSTTVTQSDHHVQEPVGGNDSLPEDLDGDGRFEDVNGDSRFDVVDVQSLFANRDGDAAQSNTSAFDFNRDGKFDISDIQSLFAEYVNR